MAAFLGNLRNVLIVSVLLALVMIVLFSSFSGHGFGDVTLWQAILRWMHVFFGILWIGLLYYFNFVQIRVMPAVPAELKPGVSKYIAPEALFWFRWSALATVIMGLAIAGSRGYLLQTLSFGLAGTSDPASHKQYALLGLGMWLGIIMMLNVWGAIWPAQKIALGIVEGDADAKAAAARKAMIFSRINTFLSVPMLVCMTMNQTVFG
jgi:uncharacterized membrane protein